MASPHALGGPRGAAAPPGAAAAAASAAVCATPSPAPADPSPGCHHESGVPCRLARQPKNRGEQDRKSVVEMEGVAHMPDAFISVSALQNDDKLRRAALPILRRLLPSWADVTGPELKCKRVSGALTNCIFVVEGPPSRTASCSEEEHAAGCDAVREPSDERHQQPLATSVNSPPPGGTASAASRKVMMRVYGVGSDSLLVREKEITWLRRLSRLGIGARLLGTFGNGRLEQYLPSTTLTKADLRDPETSAAIAARMAEMHSIVAVFPARRESATADTSLSDDSLAEYDLPGDLELWANVRKWVPLALEAAKELARIEPEKWATYEDRIGLFTLHEDIAALKERIDRCQSLIVFAHNDTQYGNILRLDCNKMLVLVDFEYAGYNYRGFDIANHFCEWMADYHSSEPHKLWLHRYPSTTEQIRFIESYVDAAAEAHPPLPIFSPQVASDAWAPSASLPSQSGLCLSPVTSDAKPPGPTRSETVHALLGEVRLFVPASHLWWALWGLVQATQSEIDFDYLEYAAQRFELFRDGIRTNPADGGLADMDAE